MSPSGQNPRFKIRDWPINTRLLLGFGLIILFVIGLALVNYFSFLTIQKSVNEALVEGLQIRDLGNRIQNDLIAARRQEQAFLLNWQEEGYENAVNNYLIPHGNAITDIRQTIVKLGSLTAGQEGPLFARINPKLAELSTALTTYRSEFNAVTNLIKEQGTEGNGIVGELESAEQALLSQISLQADDELLTLVLQLQASEKKYRVYGKQGDLEAASLTIDQIRSILTNKPEIESQNIIPLLDRYEAALTDLARVNTEINQHTQQYTIAAEAIQPLALDIAATGTEYANEQLTSVTQNTQRAQTILLIATLMTVITGAAFSFSLARQISHPLQELTKTALEIGKGDLQAEVKIQSQDEIGMLASTFNSMTQQLRDLITSLEQRVAERTAELEQTTIQSNKRADQLQTISEVARIIAGEQNIETLLPLITEVVSNRFGFYHAGIFLNDETNTFARLRAANSEGGKRMLARGHRLRIGEEGIVGYVTSIGKARIALDVGEDAIYFDNPDLPDTRSEMALPLIARGRIIGALDIQSTTPNAFKSEDASILQILADQVAIAIENARLYEETRRTLAEIETLNRQYIAERWQAITARRAIVGFYHSLTEETKPITRPVDHEEIRRAIKTGTVAVATPNENAQQKSALAVPVSIRGKTLATIHVQSSNPNRRWSQSEIALLQAVAERVGAALETARLFEESEKRAQKEKIISDISARIGATVDFQNILHTAAEELGRVIPGSEVVIQLRQDETS